MYNIVCYGCTTWWFTIFEGYVLFSKSCCLLESLISLFFMLNHLPYPNDKFILCVASQGSLPLSTSLYVFPEPDSICSWFLLYISVSGLNAHVPWRWILGWATHRAPSGCWGSIHFFIIVILRATLFVAFNTKGWLKHKWKDLSL